MIGKGWAGCQFVLPGLFIRASIGVCEGGDHFLSTLTEKRIGWWFPGLTKVPIDGQPKSIVRELEEMARTYVKVGN
jgi:hypothetical protein